MGKFRPLVPKFLGMGNIGGGLSSLNWMKNMGIGIGNTTSGVALMPTQVSHILGGLYTWPVDLRDE